MKEPRAKQRFPGGGKIHYELMRQDYEPSAVAVFPVGEVSRERAKLRATLCFEQELDPMLYFWPVENQHAFIFLGKEMEEEELKRLAGAMLRDGATLVTAMWPGRRGGPYKTALRNFGDVDGYTKTLQAGNDDATHAGTVGAPALSG